jgi:hypothetical protein
MQRHSLPLFFAAAIFTCLPGSLWAFYPVDGWWWNPQESGRGFNIEMQDDEMFIAAFHYTPDGSPLWWVANGRYNANTGRMTGQFVEFAGGQCPGCPYSPPAVVNGAGSPVTIDFHSAVRATVQWNGETIPIERQYWRFAIDQPNLFLFGEFHFTSGGLGIYFGDRIYFNDSHTDTDGTEWVVGQIRGASSNRIAVARFEPGNNRFAILLDSSPSYYQFYLFDMTKDRMEGRNWTFRKEDEPSGSGLSFIGHRVASRSYVQTGVGPHSDNAYRSERHPELLEQMDHNRHLLQMQMGSETLQQEGTKAPQLHDKFLTTLEAIQDQR